LLPQRVGTAEEEPGENQGGLDLADTAGTQARDLTESALAVAADHVADRVCAFIFLRRDPEGQVTGHT